MHTCVTKYKISVVRGMRLYENRDSIVIPRFPSYRFRTAPLSSIGGTLVSSSFFDSISTSFAFIGEELEDVDVEDDSAVLRCVFSKTDTYE